MNYINTLTGELKTAAEFVEEIQAEKYHIETGESVDEYFQRMVQENILVAAEIEFKDFGFTADSLGDETVFAAVEIQGNFEFNILYKMKLNNVQIDVAQGIDFEFAENAREFSNSVAQGIVKEFLKQAAEYVESLAEEVK